MEHVTQLTKKHLEDFFDDKLQDYQCPCCKSKEKPAIPTANDEEISFSLLDLVDIAKNNSESKKVLSTPALPLICQNCGNIYNIATYVILRHFS
ncbi:hypothetical protein VF_2648 [Aliivibrio fischeri ES114]|uniref:Uncharacterized protein n=1 Tax=Aliivibrio fischeri (strain ATCC 700601 / ES114) TaxID=312309 RepID=B1WN55_ALIF1|nr:hypothetical protein [Aliivibrio fischeri]ACB55687.1 hypothetical protein VF_2648 [Aliivibrio fischeri ES114]KLU79179.1 hypothetical protein AB192_06470 [Aliivibrio fischeri]